MISKFRIDPVTLKATTCGFGSCSGLENGTKELLKLFTNIFDKVLKDN